MQFLPFVSASQDISNAYVGHHVPLLVGLSLSMAVLAAFVSLLHTRLMTTASTTMRRNLWHLSGALSMGLGVWAMHFIGMVSFQIDVPIYYSPLITAVSVLPAVFAAWVTLSVLARGEHAWGAIVLGGVMMGSGIGAMHYTGMAAIETRADMLYLPGMFTISVVVAVLMAMLALASRRMLTPLISHAGARLVVCAVIMGLAVASMHFTAMHATVFLPVSGEQTDVTGADANFLVLGTLIVAAVIVIISAIVALMVQRQKKLENEAAARGEQVKVLTERFQSVAERVPGMVFQLHQDASGYLSFSYLSEAVRELFDTSVEAALANAKRVLERVPSAYRQQIFENLAASAETLTPWNDEFPIGLDSGDYRWLSATSMPQSSPEGGIFWNGFISDITAKKHDEETIRRLAYYDTLTGLPNRRLVLKELSQRLPLLAQAAHALLVISINLDGFKRINDVFGQALGDRLLQESARRLQAKVDTDTVLARLGADEFVILAQFETRQQALQALEPFIDSLLDVLAQPFHLPQLRHQTTASAGVVLAHDASIPGDELMRRAGLAAHRAKQDGGGRWYRYQRSIEQALSERFALEADMRTGLEHGQFELYYQLQANQDGEFFGAEALLRWPHPQRGMISPADFVPMAEANGLIVPLGEWVLQQACRQLAVWQSRSTTQHLTVSVNVSAKQFYQQNFVDKVVEIAAQAGANLRGLKLELTESLVFEDMNIVIDKMQSLRETGIRISMDDFGTGYSSLSYLSQLPFDEVKIDQAFIRRASSGGQSRDWIIVQAIINIAHSFGMEVIAEGVETEAQQRLLAESGCYRYQGFYFAKPQPAERLAL